MDSDRWTRTLDYTDHVFGEQDSHLAGLMDEAVKVGLPDIAVTPLIGRLLMILTSMTAGRLAIEVGTLGGYSGIWIARGLAPGGRLISIEYDPKHADFAEAQFERAGVGDRVQVRRGPALEVLGQLAEELGPGSVDVVFIDAEKTEYADYWRAVRPLIAVGGIVTADNVFGSNDWWITDSDDPRSQAVDELNRLVAGDRDFEAVAVPLKQGLLIGRRVGQSAPTV